LPEPKDQDAPRAKAKILRTKLGQFVGIKILQAMRTPSHEETTRIFKDAVRFLNDGYAEVRLADGEMIFVSLLSGGGEQTKTPFRIKLVECQATAVELLLECARVKTLAKEKFIAFDIPDKMYPGLVIVSRDYLVSCAAALDEV